MKKIKKIIALWLLSSIAFVNIPVTNSEWIHTERKLIHKPFWLFWPQDKTRLKDEQLCENGYSFDILDENGIVVDRYIPKWCEKEKTQETFDIIEEEEINNQEFYEETNSNEQTEDFINDLFWEEDMTEEPSDDFWTNQEIENQNENQDFYEENQEPSWGDENIDDFLENIFWKGINNNLKISKIRKELKLWAKNLVSTIKVFASTKLELNIWAISVKLIKNQPQYNSKITKLLSKVDKEFKIDSIKNDFAKNVSNVSYSLSTYLDEDISKETKDVFRKKLINDLKTLKKKYKVLKRKDFIVSKTLEKRGEL